MVTNNQIEGRKNDSGREAPNSVNSEAAMDEYLNGLNLYRKPVAKDGSCLFRAVSEHVFYTQEKHIEVRKECINFMKRNSEQFEAFIPGSFEHHLYNLQNPKEWAGQVEIVALSKLYRLDFVIYQEVDAPPSYVTENGFKDQIVLCFSNGNHYDCVYEKKYEENAAFMQSVLFEYLYDTVLPECEESDKEKAKIEEARTGSAENETKNAWIDVKSKSIKDKSNGDTSTSAEALWEINTALDPKIYRNIALEVWEQVKQEQAQLDKAIARKLQFKTGDYCMARIKDSSSNGYLKARIDDIVDDKYFVYVPELKETFYVFMECLKPLLTTPTKIEQIPYDELPGYYQKAEESQKEFQQPKRRQKGSNNRGHREDDNRHRKQDNNKNEQKGERVEGRLDSKTEASPGASHSRRDRRDRRGGAAADRSKHDRAERRETDRRGRPNEKNGRKQDSDQANNHSEDGKRMENKNVSDSNKSLKDEKSADTGAPVTQQGPTSSEPSSKNEAEKEKTAKQDESPAAFWGRMRKDKRPPETSLLPPKLSSQSDSYTETKVDYMATNDDDCISTGVKEEVAPGVKKKLETAPKDTKSESKNTRTVDAHADKTGTTKSYSAGRSQSNKPTPSRQTGRSKANKDNCFDGQSKKMSPDLREDMISSHTENLFSENDSGLQFMNDNEISFEASHQNPAKMPSPLKTGNKGQSSKDGVYCEDAIQTPANSDPATAQENSFTFAQKLDFDPQKSNHENHEFPNKQSPVTEHISSQSADDMQDSKIKSPINNINPFIAADLKENIREPEANVKMQDDQSKLDMSGCYQNLVSGRPLPASTGNDSSTHTGNLSGNNENSQEQQSTALHGIKTSPPAITTHRNEQQIKRILTKENENEFGQYFNASNLDSSDENSALKRDKSPDTESRKAQVKKVGFADTVEFSETDASPLTEYNTQERNEDSMQYADVNGISDNEESLAIGNPNYGQSMPMQMPMMLPIMHGNELMIPNYSIDPQCLDLPKHKPTLQFFFNFGVQSYIIQRQAQNYVNMQVPQMPVNANQIQHQPISVQSSSHIQIPCRAMPPTDVTAQIHNDHMEDHTAVSLAAPTQPDFPQIQQPQASYKQHNYHHNQYYNNANQYETPPRLRRGRGRGSAPGPQASFSRGPNMRVHNAQQQPRTSKRNYNDQPPQVYR